MAGVPGAGAALGSSGPNASGLLLRIVDQAQLVEARQQGLLHAFQATHLLCVLVVPLGRGAQRRTVPSTAASASVTASAAAAAATAAHAASARPRAMATVGGGTTPAGAELAAAAAGVVAAAGVAAGAAAALLPAMRLANAGVEGGNARNELVVVGNEVIHLAGEVLNTPQPLILWGGRLNKKLDGILQPREVKIDAAAFQPAHLPLGHRLKPESLLWPRLIICIENLVNEEHPPIKTGEPLQVIARRVQAHKRVRHPGASPPFPRARRCSLCAPS